MTKKEYLKAYNKLLSFLDKDSHEAYRLSEDSEHLSMKYIKGSKDVVVYTYNVSLHNGDIYDVQKLKPKEIDYKTLYESLEYESITEYHEREREREEKKERKKALKAILGD